MNPKSAIAKGKELEDFIVSKLRNSGLDPRAVRNPGSGNGKMKGDINNGLGLTIECKNTKKCPGKAEFAQLRREAMGYGVEVMVWHPPKFSLEDSVVLLNINDFLEFLKRAKEPKTAETTDSKDFAYKLRRAQNAFRELEKELN